MKKLVVFNKARFTNNAQQVLELVEMWLSTSFNGNYIIEMKRSTERRTNPQNKLMWVWCEAIADGWSEATGRVFTKAEVHDAYCLMLLPIDTPKGRVGGSTRGLTTEEMSAFLDGMYADAASDGITLLRPEDKMYEQWAMQYDC